MTTAPVALVAVPASWSVVPGSNAAGAVTTETVTRETAGLPGVVPPSEPQLAEAPSSANRIAEPRNDIRVAR